MCTLTWRITDQGYQVLFNRDEQKTRSIALPPQSFQQGDCNAFMPIDPDGQGTWIACNDQGLSLCLLNFYQGQTPASANQSRGQLIRQLAFCHDYQQVIRQIEKLHWCDFPPFTLLIFDAQLLPQHSMIPAIIWDGIEVTHTHKQSPVTSSALELDQVQAAREQHFKQQMINTPSTQPSLCQLLTYHMSHQPNAGSHSVCMHRDDAETVSLTMINVQAQQVTIDYRPGSPCQPQTLHTLSTPRKMKMEITP